MNPQRFAQGLGLFQAAVVSGLIVAWFAGFRSAGVQDISAASIADRRQPSLTAVAELADALRATAVRHVDLATAPQSMTETATDQAAVSDKPEPIVEVTPTVSSQTQPPDAPPVQMAAASMPDQAPKAVSDQPKPVVEMTVTASSQMQPTAPPVQLATASTSDPLPNDVMKGVSPIENPEDCPAADVCIDRYLWAVYERTPKEDSIKVEERRQVTVKKKGKSVTVTRTFTRLEDEDFGWKDPKAAERAGKTMMDYVVGGMDQTFKLKLFHMLRAAEQAGLAPGITSAFRDDYRQSIASGLKAASDRSYHGGSSRGGYGHGLAADVVSIKGGTRDQRYASSEALWKWIDAHGEEFGVGRPYLDRDPPHVAPIDGQEYAAHRGTKTQHAESMKKHNGLAVRDDHSAAKRPKTARSSKVRTI